MLKPHIQEWWASDSADVKSLHTASDGSSVEEHGYIDDVRDQKLYRAEFRRAVDKSADAIGFDPDGYVRVVIRGGHDGNPNTYQVLAGGDVKTSVAPNEVSKCGYLTLEGGIDEVRARVLELIVDFKNWKDTSKYPYQKHTPPA